MKKKLFSKFTSVLLAVVMTIGMGAVAFGAKVDDKDDVINTFTTFQPVTYNGMKLLPYTTIDEKNNIFMEFYLVDNDYDLCNEISPIFTDDTSIFTLELKGGAVKAERSIEKIEEETPIARPYIGYYVLNVHIESLDTDGNQQGELYINGSLIDDVKRSDWRCFAAVSGGSIHLSNQSESIYFDMDCVPYIKENITPNPETQTLSATFAGSTTTQYGDYEVAVAGSLTGDFQEGENVLTKEQINEQTMYVVIRNKANGEVAARKQNSASVKDTTVTVSNGQVVSVTVGGQANTANGRKDNYSVTMPVQ